jgi:hypothetical protein
LFGYVRREYDVLDYMPIWDARILWGAYRRELVAGLYVCHAWYNNLGEDRAAMLGAAIGELE